MNLRLVPQDGGTVAGVRFEPLREIGSWNENSLTEDTDLTYRLVLNGWKTLYQNRSECYEEVPEVWPVRIKNKYARRARTLTLADTIVAAIAIERRCTLMTDNRKDFPMPELNCYNLPQS
jgi:cellulose synthase/poly-beta-1,6-N-acetylglucosamine synthase-like glycosyltransferase